MATIAAVSDRNSSYHGGVVTVTWAALTNTGPDSGAPIELAGFSEKTFQVTGTLGAAGAVVIEGSNEATPVNWAPLSNRQGTAMSFTALGLNTSQDRPRWVRPRITAGDGTTSLTVIAVCHRFDAGVKG